MTQREWAQPATVVIHEALMPAFEEWLEGRSLVLTGPIVIGDDPDDKVWTVAPKVWPAGYMCEKCGFEVFVREADSNQHEYSFHRMDGAYWFPADDEALE